MAIFTESFTQADGAWSYSTNWDATAYGTVNNIASNRLVQTSGSEEIAYKLKASSFTPADSTFGVEAAVGTQYSYQDGIYVGIGDFSAGGGTEPKGYFFRYDTSGSGPEVNAIRIIKKANRYSDTTVVLWPIPADTAVTVGLLREVNGTNDITLRLYIDGVEQIGTAGAGGSGSLPYTDSSTGYSDSGFTAVILNSYPDTLAFVDSVLIDDTYGVDTTAPTVSSVSGTGTTSSTADLTATVDEYSDVYFYVSNSATPPSEANHLAGTGAAAFDSVLGASAGVVDTNVTGLSVGTWYLHVRAVDQSDNVSSVVTSSSFTLSANLNVTGITGTVGYGQTITISAIDLGSEGSVTLSQGSYSDTLTIVDWDSVANTVEVGIPAIASSELIPGSATLTVTNAATQSDTYATTLVMPSGKNTVTLTGVATEGIIPTDEPLAAGMVVMFDTVISSGGTPTAYTFDVTNQAVMVVDGTAPDGDYTVAARVWNTGVWGAEANVPFTLGQTDITLTPTAGTISVAGNTPTLTQTEHINLAPATGSASIAGNTPSVIITDNIYLFPSVGSVSYQGETPVVSQTGDVVLSPSTGSVYYTGNVVTLSIPITLTPTSGNIVINGNTPVVSQRPSTPTIIKYIDLQFTI